MKKFDPKQIKALALDLDGTTLLPNHTLGEKTIHCLKQVIANGMQVLFATGRAPEASARYYTEIGAHGPMVFFNGAVVSDVPSGEKLSVSYVDLDVVDFAIELARSRGIHIQLYLSMKIEANEKSKWELLVIDRQSPEAESYNRHTGIVPQVNDLKDIINSPKLLGCIKAMFITDSSLHDELRKKMQARFGDQISMTRSSPTYLEILNKGVSKGAGLKTAMSLRGLTSEEVIAFGDEENDVSMFSVAGFSAVPSNAGEEIRKAAGLVFGSCAEEGLAAFIVENFLTR